MLARLKTFKISLFLLLIGIGLALFSLTPQGTKLEENFGLPWLFKLRGHAPMPKQVVIVSIDQISAQVLHLSDDPKQWPRSYYAELINKINQQNPAIIAFNMIFDEQRDLKSDQMLADAIAKGNNVILSSYLKKHKQPLGESWYERVIEPISVIKQATLATAPFPLPNESFIKQFWAYKNSAGDIATMPVAVFQNYVFKQVHSEISKLLHQLKAESDLQLNIDVEQVLAQADAFSALPEAFSNDSRVHEQLKKLIDSSSYAVEKKQLLRSWLGLLKKPNSLYFNYYGRAETITTLPFYQVLTSNILNPDLFNNKIVMVGYSETIESDKLGFHTVFSNTVTEFISPIEIAATAVANLLDHSWLKPLSPNQQFLLIVCLTLLLMICQLLSYKKAVSLIIILTISYFVLAYSLFVTAAIWLPMLIPLILLVPIGLTVVSITRFLKGKQEHQKMQQAFSLYVPGEVVSSFAQDHDPATMNHYGALMLGVCMATDAGQYTALSESMDPDKLHSLINEYYAIMFPQVKRHQGIISDVIGDAMFAIWKATESASQARSNACSAALAISKAVADFNRSQPYQLPTRIGLHFGSMRLGNVGAADHYEYRAVGDIVNTTARIEGLNKLLGTQILVTADVIAGLNDYFCRELGFFILKGKTRPVHIYELISQSNQQTAAQSEFADDFTAALKLFQKQQWDQAFSAWKDLNRSYPSDGPSLFYLHYLQQKRHLAVEQQQSNSQPTVIKIGNITTPLHYDD